MTAKSKQSEAPIQNNDKPEDVLSKARAWNQDAGEKLRELAGKVNADIRTAGNDAIESHAQHSARLFQLVGDLLNKRTAATRSLLQSTELQKAIEIEQNHARDVADTLREGVRELNEIGYAALKNASENYSARTKDAVESLAQPKQG